MESHEIVGVSILSSKEFSFALVISAVLSLMDIGSQQLLPHPLLRKSFVDEYNQK
jgi:hypothetical protein